MLRGFLPYLCIHLAYPPMNYCLQYPRLIQITFSKLLLLKGITAVNLSLWLTLTDRPPSQVCLLYWLHFHWPDTGSSDPADPVPPQPDAVVLLERLRGPEHWSGREQGSQMKTSQPAMGLLCYVWPQQPLTSPAIETPLFLKGRLQRLKRLFKPRDLLIVLLREIKRL